MAAQIAADRLALEGEVHDIQEAVDAGSLAMVSQIEVRYYFVPLMLTLTLTLHGGDGRCGAAT